MIIGLVGRSIMRDGTCSMGAGKDTVADFITSRRENVKVALADPIKRAAMDWWKFTETQLWGPSSERNAPDLRYQLGHRAPCGCVGQLRAQSSDQTKRWFGSIEYSCARHAGEERDWYRGRVFDQSDVQEHYLTPRHALQMIGTEVGRLVDAQVWLRTCVDTAKRLMENPDLHYNHLEGVYHRALNSLPTEHVVVPDVRFKNELEYIKDQGGIVILIERPVYRPITSTEATKHPSERELDHMKNDNPFWNYVIQNNGTLAKLQDEVNHLLDAL